MIKQDRYRYIVLACLGFLVSVSVSVEAALLDHWKLNEGTGTSAADAAGANNTGTLQNMEAGDWVAGVSGTALDFGGTNEEITTTSIYSNPQTYSNNTSLH